MKTIRHKVINVRNPYTGKFEKLGALRGESAYEAAVAAGFEGTKEEWLEILIRNAASAPTSTITSVTLRASAWKGENNLHSQTVDIEGVTQYSKIDLQPSVGQLAIFHEKDITFVTENDNGVVTVFVIGVKPTMDYTIQATITEVSV